MSVQFADNVLYKGAKFFDDRILVKTLAEIKNLPEYNYPDRFEILCEENKIWYVLNKSMDPTPELGRWKKKQNSSDDINISVRRISKYLYEATYDNLPEYKENKNINTFARGCTSFARNGKTYRSFDLIYDNTAEFLIRTTDYDGIAVIQGMDDGELNKEKIEQLPYHLADGCNRNGITVTEHVLYNDMNFEGTGEKTNDLTKLPTVILQNIKSMAELTNNPIINNFLSNCKLPEALETLDYALHFFITDGTTSYTLAPKDDGSIYEFKDITSNPKLTNFKHVNGKIVDRTDMDLQERPNGIERWNMIENGATLEDLRFTKCYETPDRLSEFIGENGTDKHSTDGQLLEIYETAHIAYESRTRGGEEETWQSVHSIVYGENGIEHLWVQENYDKDYIASSGGTGEWDDIQNKPFKILNMDDFSVDSDGELSINIQDTGQIGEFKIAAFLLDNFIAADGTTEYDKNGVYKELFNTLTEKAPALLLSGSDANHFKLLDLRDKFIKLDGTPLQTGGEKSHKLTTSEMPSHSHTTTGDASHKHGVGSGAFYFQPNTSGSLGPTVGMATTTQKYDGFMELGGGNHTHTISSTGGSQSHNNEPQYITMIPQFRYKMDKVSIQGPVSDVKVNNISVVDEEGVANIDSGVMDVIMNGVSVVDGNKVAQLGNLPSQSSYEVLGSGVVIFRYGKIRTITLTSASKSTIESIKLAESDSPPTGQNISASVSTYSSATSSPYAGFFQVSGSNRKLYFYGNPQIELYSSATYIAR